MSDAPTEPTAAPAEPVAPAPVPGKPGRKPAVPKVVDTRPLPVRVAEVIARLRANDRTIYAALRHIEVAEQARRDAHNLVVTARAAAGATIRAREKWIQDEAVRIVQKETGIHTIPGYAKPPNKGLDRMIATQARLKAAREKAMAQLHTELPPAP